RERKQPSPYLQERIHGRSSVHHMRLAFETVRAEPRYLGGRAMLLTRSARACCARRALYCPSRSTATDLDRRAAVVWERRAFFGGRRLTLSLRTRRSGKRGSDPGDLVDDRRWRGRRLRGPIR